MQFYEDANGDVITCNNIKKNMTLIMLVEVFSIVLLTGFKKQN